MDSNKLASLLGSVKKNIRPYTSNGKLAFQVDSESKSSLTEYFNSQEETKLLSTNEYRDSWGYLVQLSMVISWVVERIFNEDPEVVANQLSDYFSSEYISGNNLLVIAGFSDKFTRFDGKNFSLLPLSDIPNSVVKDMLQSDNQQMRFLQSGMSFSAILSREFEVPRFQQEGISPKYPISNLPDVASMLSLLGPCSVSPIAYWWQPANQVPTFMLNSCHGFRHDITSQATLSIKSSAAIADIDELVGDFLNINESEKNRIRIALKYFNQSMCKNDEASKAIDLAIALESLLLDDRDKTEFAFTFRLRGAKLLAEDIDSRKAVFKNLKHLYNYRGAAVHSGKLKNSSEIRNNLKYSIQICADIIRKRIKEGRPNWDDLVLR